MQPDEESCLFQVERQMREKVLLQHFEVNLAATAVGVGRPLIRIFPAAVAAVNEARDGAIPAGEFDEAAGPGIQVPAAETGPDIAVQQLPRAADVLHVVEHLLNRPPLGADLQNSLRVQLWSVQKSAARLPGQVL